MKTKRKMNKTAKFIVLSVLIALVFVAVLDLVILPLTGELRRAEHAEAYDGDNQYIAYDRGIMLSAHRAGGDLEPEETMAAFKACVEAAEYKVDILEFDLHITKDNVLVLLHDDTVDRTSDSRTVFGRKNVKASDMTYDELLTLNFGCKFQAPDGSYPYADVSDPQKLEDVRILRLEVLLDYLESESQNRLNYIIEIKDKGAAGKRATDQLVRIMEQYDIVDRAVVGTFNADVTRYIDKCYSDKIKRSASVLEVLNFYYAFLWGVKRPKHKFDVMQIPVGLDHYFDLSTAAFMDYAHANDIALQYWTINDPDEAARLAENGADAILTDNPEAIYAKLH